MGKENEESNVHGGEIGMEINRPEDIRPQWWNYFLKIIRRLQSVSRQNEGYAIIGLLAVVNSDGNPIFYTSPRVIRLEPKRDVIFDILKDEISEEAMQTVLELIWRYG